MEPSVTLNLSDEFRFACLLYNMEPEAFLQEFVYKVMLPSKYLEPEPENILATRFMIDFVNLKGVGIGVEEYAELKEFLRELKVDVSEHSVYTREQIEFLQKKERQRLVLCRKPS